MKDFPMWEDGTFTPIDRTVQRAEKVVIVVLLSYQRRCQGKALCLPPPWSWPKAPNSEESQCFRLPGWK